MEMLSGSLAVRYLIVKDLAREVFSLAPAFEEVGYARNDKTTLIWNAFIQLLGEICKLTHLFIVWAAEIYNLKLRSKSASERTAMTPSLEHTLLGFQTELNDYGCSKE